MSGRKAAGALLLLLAAKLQSDASKQLEPPFGPELPAAGTILRPEAEERHAKAASLKRSALAVGALGAFMLLR